MTAWRLRAVERAKKRVLKEAGYHRVMSFRDGATLLAVVRAIEETGCGLTVEVHGRGYTRALLPNDLKPTLFGAAPTVFVA